MLAGGYNIVRPELGFLVAAEVKSPFTRVNGVAMDISDLIFLLAIGAVAGWLAGKLMRGGGFGLLGNIAVGIIGAVIGKFVFGLLGITASGLIGLIVTATAGAALLLFLVDLVKKS